MGMAKYLNECLPAKFLAVRRMSSRRAEKNLIQRGKMIDGRIVLALGTCTIQPVSFNIFW
jgi:hypothetical protein